LRISPELHGIISVAATTQSKSLNQWIVDTLQEAVK